MRGALAAALALASLGVHDAAAQVPSENGSSPRHRLIPPECVLIYNANSSTSEDLARYYAKRRGVPDDHLLGIRMPIRESIGREEYEERIAPAVRRFLADQVWGRSVRCLVTFYDVPLRVQRDKATNAELTRAGEVEQRFHEVCDQIETLMASELGTLPGAAAALPARAKRDKPEYLSELFKRYSVQRNVLRQRLRDVTDDEGMRLQAALLESVGRLEGEPALLATFRPQGQPGDDVRSATVAELLVQFDRMRKRIQEILAKGVMSDERPQAWPLIERTEGLFRLAERLAVDVRTLRGEETSAALDSELALVLTESHETYRWLPNPAFSGGDLNAHRSASGSPATTVDSGASPALMVARLDAPSAGLVRRMIDDAIAVEASGLSGTVYIDARGIGTRDTYGLYDDDLRKLADWVRSKTDLELVLNNNPELFGAGECPKAALYCGWYSVGEYVDAFDFVPGAVAFHIASFELRSLRNADKRYWCPELLRDGVVATLGPTAEPYLHTFPLPSEFFGLLLTGEYTLAECFQRANPYLSWQMCLLGDPLYRPFARSPKLKMADVIPAGGPPPDAEPGQ